MAPLKVLTILGVIHTTRHPSHAATLDWLRNNLKPGMHVGIEMPRLSYLNDPILTALNGRLIDRYGPKKVRTYTLKDMEFSAVADEVRKFFDDVRTVAHEKGALTHPLDSEPALNRIRCLCQEEDRLEGQLDAQEARQAELDDSLSGTGGGFVRANSGLYVPKTALKDAKNKEKAELEEEIGQTRGALKENRIQQRIYHALRSKIQLKNVVTHGYTVGVVGAGHARHMQEFAPHIQLRILYPGLAEEDIAHVLDFAPGQPQRQEKIMTRLRQSFQAVSAPRPEGKRRSQGVLSKVTKVFTRRQ